MIAKFEIQVVAGLNKWENPGEHPEEYQFGSMTDVNKKIQEMVSPKNLAQISIEDIRVINIAE